MSLVTDLSRGIVLLVQRDGDRFELGPSPQSGSSFLAASPHTSASLWAEVFASEGGKRVIVEQTQLLLPGHSPLATPLARSTLMAKIDKLERVRGGAISLSLEGELSDSTGTFHVRLKAQTFVRDVVNASARYAAGLRGFGDAGAMR